MLRAAAAPERFLTRGLARLTSRAGAPLSRRGDGARAVHLGVVVPADLARWLDASSGRSVGDFVPSRARSGAATFSSLVAAARRSPRARASLGSLLAGALPFGATRGGELWLYVVGDATNPSRGVVATLDPAVPSAPKLAFRDAASFALACVLEASAESGEAPERASQARAKLALPGVAEQEAVRAAFDRATALVDLVVGADAAARRAAKKLALRPLDVPPPPSSARLAPRRRKAASRGTQPLALGPLVEAFFRQGASDVALLATVQRVSEDAIVSEAARAIEDALRARPRTALGRELARRRALALRAARAHTRPAKPSSEERIHRTRRIIEQIDASPPPTDPLAVSEPREEALLALAELGEPAVVPSLVARAVTGDASAVEMLAAIGDASAVAPLVSLLGREPQRNRQLDAAVVRALASLDAKSATSALRELLADSPMPSWREGIERGVLVRELVSALGALGDHEAAPLLLHVLEERGQEYRAILPSAAWALGRIRHLPALATVERLLASPKEAVTSEAIWAAGAIGAAHESGRERARALLSGLAGLEPGAEMVRLTALAKLRASEGTPPTSAGRDKGPPRTTELRRALERALWEPGFRQEETARRRTWALRSLEELAELEARPPRRRSAGGGRPRGDDAAPLFLGHEAVRYLVTRDDHRVRRAAVLAFTAWRIPVPETRRYYAVSLDDLEARGGLDALHEALRDPLGVYRHNIATRLAERGNPASVRPLAEATARMFAEPPTSAYEYDDAPRHLVAFVRAVAKLNRPEGNDVLIDGLRSGNHQVRAVVAENAPEDPRFVPELMAMLGDPRSFLRSRAERSLAALGVSATGTSSDRPTRLVEV